MTTTDDPATLDLVTAGHRLRAGTLTSTVLTEACLARIDARNEELRAFITVTADLARAAARDADRELKSGVDRGPLHGIPISLKDLIDQAGVATTAGSHVRTMDPVPFDAIVTSRLKAGGAVLVGKTNLHEFAFGTTSEQSAFGAVRNPLDPSRSAGGSSGGSAVAVATGMSIASIGTDTGGSIRIPASACGLVGLKPATGEVPCDGVVPLSKTLDHVGPLTRSVADAAVVYHVLARTTPRRPVPRAIRGLRFARLTGYMEARLQPEVRAAYEAALDRLTREGVRLVSRSLPHADDIPGTYVDIVSPEASAYHAATLSRCPERYLPQTRERLERGRHVLAEAYLSALARRLMLRAEVDAALADVDAIVVAGMAIEPPVQGSDSIAIDGIAEPVRALMLRLTQPFSLTGHPAIVLPGGVTSGTLRSSIQLVGQLAGTTALLDVAATVEDTLRG